MNSRNLFATIGLLAAIGFSSQTSAVLLNDGDSLGVIGTTHITYEVQVPNGGSPALFLFTNDFDIEDPNNNFNMTLSNIVNINLLSAPIFENDTDSEFVPSSDTHTDVFLPNLGLPFDYHLHLQGLVGAGGGSFDMTVWANPSPIPVPAAVWLFGSGLTGLIAVARRRA